jgi:hypothetical protein
MMLSIHQLKIKITLNKSEKRRPISILVQQKLNLNKSVLDVHLTHVVNRSKLSNKLAKETCKDQQPLDRRIIL